MNGRNVRCGEAGRAWTVCALGAAAVAAVAGACALAGCGGGARDTARAPYTAPPVTQAASAEAVRPPAAAPAHTAGAAVAERESVVPATMPPGLDVSVGDTLVAPGQIVQVTARATPDVERLELRDDAGETQPFVRDAGGGTWRASWRAPLAPRAGRMGLSVTARTAAGRWRRLWVFVRVDRAGDGAAPETPPEIPGSAAGR